MNVQHLRRRCVQVDKGRQCLGAYHQPWDLRRIPQGAQGQGRRTHVPKGVYGGPSQGIRTQRYIKTRAVASEETTDVVRVIQGKAYVTRDNIDTDQIIPAGYLMLVPSKPDELEQLGMHAMEGLPEDLYPTRYMEEGKTKTEYKVIIGGENFGCGSSREHAPICVAAAGTKVIVAQSYARIFFRNCISTGEIYPCEVDERLCDKISTGDDVTVDMEKNIITNHTKGEEYSMKSLGEAGPVIDAGGIFEYARKMGMIKK